MSKLRSGRRTATTNSGGDDAGGASTGAAKKKRSADESNEAEDAKKFKRAKPSICKAAEELVCPILQDLPIDPVIAADGQIYERKEIEKYLKKKEDEDEILSPVTQEPFETTTLVPSVHTRNVIEHLIESGIIEGGMADTWKERMEEKRESEEKARRAELKVKRWREEAEKGDTDAMFDLAHYYEYGENGLEVDQEEAYKLYKKGSDAGDVYCMAVAGFFQLLGQGTETKESDGLVLIALAAEKGSDHACHSLGECYYKGLHGISKDTEKAKFWLEKAVAKDCEYTHLDDDEEEEARGWIAEINSALET